MGYFERTISQLETALQGISEQMLERLISECERTLRSGHKIIASGLGKNVPICEKFEGTMLSLGLEAQFLHTNSAVHGDMGMLKEGDLVMLLTKSGNTKESVYLADLLIKSGDVNLWLISCSEKSILADRLENKLIIPLANEGDPWNIMPNNSTTVYLILLQTIAMQLIDRMGVTLATFKKNHPGGSIGERLSYE